MVKCLHHVQFRFKAKRIQQQYRLFKYILVLELKLLRQGLTEWKLESARSDFGRSFDRWIYIKNNTVYVCS